MVVEVPVPISPSLVVFILKMIILMFAIRLIVRL